MVFDNITERYAVLVYQDGEIIPIRTVSTDEPELAMVAAKDETKRMLIEGTPDGDIHMKVVLYDLDEDRIIYTASVDWYE